MSTGFTLSLRQAAIQTKMPYLFLVNAVHMGYLKSQKSGKTYINVSIEDVQEFKQKLEECFGKQINTGDDPSGVT